MIIYVDGIFDLFHRGHLESFKFIKEKYPNCKLYVGVISDNDAKSYKRSPIIFEEDRTEIIRGIKYVDKVIFPAPLIITKSFLDDFTIDKVVHGFSNPEDEQKQKKLFEVPINLNMFEVIPYYDLISTTDIIEKTKKEY